jgi:transcriptional regulator with XRE-family HTH domain
MKYSNRVFLAHYQALDNLAKLALARKVGTEYSYLRQIAHGSRKPGVDLAQRLAKALNVTPADIRPDIWKP